MKESYGVNIDFTINVNYGNSGVDQNKCNSIFIRKLKKLLKDDMTDILDGYTDTFTELASEAVDELGGEYEKVRASTNLKATVEIG
jgi:hypothetical protein